MDEIEMEKWYTQLNIFVEEMNTRTSKFGIPNTLLKPIQYGEYSTPELLTITWIIFWRGVQPQVWNLYLYIRIFLKQKMADLTFNFFSNQDSFPNF